MRQQLLKPRQNLRSHTSKFTKSLSNSRPFLTEVKVFTITRHPILGTSRNDRLTKSTSWESVKHKEAEKHYQLMCAVVLSKTTKKIQTFHFYFCILLKTILTTTDFLWKFMLLIQTTWWVVLEEKKKVSK